MVVIADTSPLNYLILIGVDHILPKLYNQVVVPPAVIRELRHGDAPASVRQWIARPPVGLRIALLSSRVDPALDLLGAGEREAIILAEDTSDALPLMDEAKGRGLAPGACFDRNPRCFGQRCDRWPARPARRD